MSNGWAIGTKTILQYKKQKCFHPELLDRLQHLEEELLTVRFSNDDSTLEEKGSTSD